MNHLLDTCVISELAAKTPNPKVIDWIDGIDPNSAYLSVITLGEIRKGVAKLPESKRKTALETWLSEDLPERFSGRILAVGIEVTLTWGQFTGSLEAEGKKMAAVDSLIAAIALHHHCALVTRNEADFRHAGVTLVNPWT